LIVDFDDDVYFSLDTTLTNLSNAIAERRRKMLHIKDGAGTIVIKALYKVKNKNEPVSRRNLQKMSNLDQIFPEDELCVSIRPSDDIKIKKSNRRDLALQEKERKEEFDRAVQQQRIDLLKANEELAELRPLKEKIHEIEAENQRLREEINSLKRKLSKSLNVDEEELEVKNNGGTKNKTAKSLKKILIPMKVGKVTPTLIGKSDVKRKKRKDS